VVLNARYRKSFDHWHPGLELFINAYNLTDESAAIRVTGSPENEMVYPYPGFNIYGGIRLNF
jgi:hypothetical protein